jgi:probable HAF family extracellular repeat protein
MSARKQLLKLLLAPLLASPLSALAGPAYQATFFPDTFRANAISNSGQVVGYTDISAAIWRNGALTTYSTGDDRFAMFTAISSNGLLAGTWDDPGGSGGAHMFIYQDGAMREVGALYGSNTFSNAINASGQVAGSVEDVRTGRPVLYSGGALKDIGDFGGEYAYARDINDSGTVVGYSDYADRDGRSSQAFTYRDGVMTDIGTPGGARWSEAKAINAAGEIAGSFATDTFDQHAFIYSGGAMIDIGTLDDTSEAFDINALRQVVGTSYLRDIGLHAFLYANGKMEDLNAMVAGIDGWTLTSAGSINDSGQILAWACQGGNCRDVLLNPVSAVPEPGTWAMLLAGLGGLLARSRRRRTKFC